MLTSPSKQHNHQFNHDKINLNEGKKNSSNKIEVKNILVIMIMSGRLVGHSSFIQGFFFSLLLVNDTFFFWLTADEHMKLVLVIATCTHTHNTPIHTHTPKTNPLTRTKF